MKVTDAMTHDVMTLASDASLKEAAELFDRHGIGGAPVVDVAGHVIGVLTDKDIVIKERGSVPHRSWRDLLLRPAAVASVAAKVEARIVADAMSAPAIAASARWSIADVADVMIEHGVNRLPVLDDEKLVGIITRHDLVHAFARSDAEIEEDIRDEALRGLALPEQIAVEVHEGAVTLRGEVESTYDAEAVPRMVRRVPGVVAVDSELNAWDTDKQRTVVVASHKP